MFTTTTRAHARPLLLGIASLVAAGTMLVPTAAGASEDGADTTAATTGDDLPAQLRPRLERACLRIPNLEIRTGNLLERLNGDETVRGSLAWLQTRIDEASAAGRDQLATVLENRLAVRTQSIEVLELRQTELTALRQLCADHGVDL